MRYRVISPSELDGSLAARWLEILKQRPDLASPYFHPALSRELGRVRPVCRVTVMEDESGVTGFFPFERGAWGLGRAIGGPVSDAHGVISVPGAEWSARELVAGSGLSGWVFDHLVSEHEKFTAFQTASGKSPLMDVSAGFDAYSTSVKSVRSQQRRKWSKMEREHGAAVFTVAERDHAALDVLLGWKSDQCRATGSPDMFGVRWTRDLLHNLLDIEDHGFSGILTSLRLAGKPVALHMGIRSSTVWHWWFPSYSQEFAAYSPGVAMLLHMAEHSPGMGIRTIDLGKGDARYKDDLSNASVPLLEGCVETGGLISRGRALLGTAERSAGRLGPLSAPFRLYRRRVYINRYR